MLATQEAGFDSRGGRLFKWFFLPLGYWSLEKIEPRHIEMVLLCVQISIFNKFYPCHLWANIEISARYGKDKNFGFSRVSWA